MHVSITFSLPYKQTEEKWNIQLYSVLRFGTIIALNNLHALRPQPPNRNKSWTVCVVVQCPATCTGEWIPIQCPHPRSKINVPTRHQHSELSKKADRLHVLVNTKSYMTSWKVAMIVEVARLSSAWQKRRPLLLYHYTVGWLIVDPRYSHVQKGRAPELPE